MELSTIHPLIFEEEASPNCGEDCYFSRRLKNGLIVMGVFDGCGGIGGRRYERFNGKTGAWIGSQVASYAADAFFCNEKFAFNKISTVELRDFIYEKLNSTKNKISDSNGIQIGGSLNKSLPTTISIIAAKSQDTSNVLCEYLWAGDSRGYILDSDGLCQLTTDDIDLNADDAYLNLREDGILTNVANADKPFELHCGTININRPSLLISATDGCFAYFLTPMDFEKVILHSLVNSDTPEQWQELLCRQIKLVTGDDYTMSIACFGFTSFKQMKEHFCTRLDILENKYIQKQDADNETSLIELWNEYKSSYYRYKLDMEN